MRSHNYGQRRRPHTGPEVYLVGLERRDDVLHALLWGPLRGEFAMPVGDEQPRGRVRIEMLKVGVFGRVTHAADILLPVCATIGTGDGG